MRERERERDKHTKTHKRRTFRQIHFVTAETWSHRKKERQKKTEIDKKTTERPRQRERQK